MIEKRLEILLITYNRSNDLDNTLKQLLESPFSNCKITVLDNCSTDDTTSVCAKYQKIFPQMKIKRHDKNIGASPNYLRAVELSKSTYTWILCDDDTFDFNDCSDVINAIESEKFDIIIVGAPCQCEWEKGVSSTSKELIKKGSKYHYILGFMPSTIFKTKFFDSDCIIKGYRNVINMFPQFEFINKSIENNLLVYISKNEIIKRGEHTPPTFPEMKFIISWINSCSTIKDKKLRREVIYQEPNNSNNDSFKGFIKRIIHAIIIEKMLTRNSKFFKPLMSSLITSGVPLKDQLILLPVITSMYLSPSFIYVFSQKIYRFQKYKLRGETAPKLTFENEFDHTRY